MVDGKRVQMSLGTSDYAEAVTKAMDIRADPFLIIADPLRGEIEAFIDYKVRQNEYSSASADSKRYALNEFASFVGKADPSDNTSRRGAILSKAPGPRSGIHCARLHHNSAQLFQSTFGDAKGANERRESCEIGEA